MKIKYLLGKSYLSLFSILPLFFIVLSCNRENPKSSLGSRDLLPGNSCYDEVVGIGCTEVTDTFTFSNLASFPGCTFAVAIKYCLFPTGSATIEAGDYQLISTCQDFQDSLNFLLGNASDAVLNSFIASIDLQIFNQLVYELFALHCTNINCNNPVNNNIIITFNRPSCYSFCLFRSDAPDGGGLGRREGDPPAYWVKSACDSNGCCALQSTVCFNTNTQMIEVSTLVYKIIRDGILEVCASGAPDDADDRSVIRCLPCNFDCPQ